jgi:hypothetical protein
VSNAKTTNFHPFLDFTISVYDKFMDLIIILVSHNQITDKSTLQSGLHLYGKSDARVGRKMGHITALGETTEWAKAKVENVFAQLSRTR